MIGRPAPESINNPGSGRTTIGCLQYQLSAFAVTNEHNLRESPVGGELSRPCVTSAMKSSI